MSKPLTNWRKARKRTPFVGRFFETLAARIIHARPVRQGDEDLAVPKVGLGFEVKAGDNNRLLRIPVDQLERHIELSGGFPNPYERFLYCLFCYQNRQKLSVSRKNGQKTRRSHLSQCKSEFDIYSVLAEYVDSLYVLDSEFLVAIGKRCGHSTGSLPCSCEQQTINLDRKTLQSFNELNAKTMLEFYGLKASDWIVRERQMKINIEVGDPGFPFAGLNQFLVNLKVVEVIHQETIEGFDTHVRPGSNGRPTRRRLSIKVQIPAPVF